MDVTLDFEVSAGHRLPGHAGRCHRLHGHNYRGKATVSGMELNSLGMVIDFGDLKSAIKVVIDEVFDHRLILYTGDPFLETLQNLPGVMSVPYMPTVENLAQAWADGLAAYIGRPVRLKLWETRNSSATVHSTG